MLKQRLFTQFLYQKECISLAIQQKKISWPFGEWPNHLDFCLIGVLPWILCKTYYEEQQLNLTFWLGWTVFLNTSKCYINSDRTQMGL